MAETLVSLGVEVLAIDADPQRVKDFAEILPVVRQADGSSQNALRQLGIEQFDAAVVAIGTGIEASILTTSALVDVGVPNVWAKAITTEHGRILERVGAHLVVDPEKQMGEWVAHAVTGAVVDYFALDEGFVIAELEAPPRFVAKTLEEAAIRQTHGVTVVCIKPPGRPFIFATARPRSRSGICSSSQEWPPRSMHASPRSHQIEVVRAGVATGLPPGVPHGFERSGTTEAGSVLAPHNTTPTRFVSVRRGRQPPAMIAARGAAVAGSTTNRSRSQRASCATRSSSSDTMRLVA